MQMNDSQRIPASREKVWAALNDPEILRHCIPGCQSLEKTSETSFAAIAKVKIGPVSATFKGSVQLSDLDPPNGYTISGEGEGGIAGFAKGGAKVRLTDAEVEHIGFLSGFTRAGSDAQSRAVHDRQSQ